MRRLALLLLGIVVLLAGGVAAVNGVVDPSNEFYSSGPLEAALSSHCVLADDLVGARSYPEFKHDLFRRRNVNRVVLGANTGGSMVANMSFPGFGTTHLLDAMTFLASATPHGKRLAIRIATDASWFNVGTRVRSFDESLISRIGYLLSPWTLKSSLDLIRTSRTLAFTGWQKERAGGACVVDRGSPQPAWRRDGTFTGSLPRESTAWSGFAWHRLTPLDAALEIAQQRGWRVFGRSTPGPEAYERELSALFAKHGYKWRVRRMPE
jgi:hypothetical protein